MSPEKTKGGRSTFFLHRIILQTVSLRGFPVLALAVSRMFLITFIENLLIAISTYYFPTQIIINFFQNL